jgi:hypothetical protein
MEGGPLSIGRCSPLVSPEVNVIGTLNTPDKVGCVLVSIENAPPATVDAAASTAHHACLSVLPDLCPLARKKAPDKRGQEWIP